MAPCSHVWHYKCIRPILNDHKTWPQFLCPNCRAVADLEADVDDPSNVSWEEDEVEAEAEAEAGKDETDGINATAGLPGSSEDDDSINASTSQLSIVNESDESASGAKQVPQTAPSISTPQSSLLSRRNFAGSAPFSLGPDFRQARSSGEYLRPITPGQSLFHDNDVTPSIDMTSHSGSEQNVFEQLLSNGPMTPTNNAGPFVFDGSATGGGGHPLAGLISHNRQSSA